MEQNKYLIDYTLHLADTALVLGHRISEWSGHGPVLEQDIAMSNIALDLIGQARFFYQYAATLDNTGKTEDDFAYLRDIRMYKNLLLVEVPNTDFAYTIARQFYFSHFSFLFYEQLIHSKDLQLSAIAEKSLKEVSYHLKWTNDWVLRLGDGTEESKTRIQNAIDELYRYTDEMFTPVEFELNLIPENTAVDVISLKNNWLEKIKIVLDEATLIAPTQGWMQFGGKIGNHTEDMGFLLAELQYMQRAYPNCEW